MDEMPLPSPHILETISAARDAQRNAHAIYSNYHVGAAIRGADGRLFVGCNVENKSFGLTNCAERTAVFSAVAAGVRQFEHLAMSLPKGQYPCGACLQVLSEFCDELPIWIVDSDQPALPPKQLLLTQLLPIRFQLEE